MRKDIGGIYTTVFPQTETFPGLIYVGETWVQVAGPTQSI